MNFGPAPLRACNGEDVVVVLFAERSRWYEGSGAKHQVAAGLPQPLVLSVYARERVVGLSSPQPDARGNPS